MGDLHFGRQVMRDLRAIAAAIAVLAIGAVIVRYLMADDKLGRGTPITALLAITVIIYALVSGRLNEFSAPGGWKAKFSEAADRPVAMTAEAIGSTSLDLHTIPKVDVDEVIRRIKAEGGDGKPIILAMTLGYWSDDENLRYNEDNLRKILEYLAVTRNFRALVIVGERSTLIAYAPARQAALLTAPSLKGLREEFVKAVVCKKISGTWNRELLTDAHVTLGTSYSDALQTMNDQSLSCIAVVDRTGRFRGIVDRDHIATSLLLALARTGQDRPMRPSKRNAQAPSEAS